MNGLPYYKAYPRDFVEGTIGMPFDLKGAYRLVLDLIYMQGGKLEDDPRYIAGLLGCSVRAWNSYRAKLAEMGKIVIENGIISNFRADKELESLRTFQDKQRENGMKPKKNKALTEATAEPKPNHTEPEPEEKKKTTSSSKSRATRLPSEWVLPKAWGEWAVAEGMTEARVRHEANQFRDYWLGVGGAKARKVDWQATWRKWVRTAMDREASSRKPSRISSTVPQYGEQRTTKDGRTIMWAGAIDQWVEVRQ